MARSIDNRISRRGQIPLSVAIVLMIVAIVFAAVLSFRDAGASEASNGRQQIVFWNAQVFGDDINLAIHQFEQQNPQYQVIVSTSVSPDLTSDGQRLLCAVAGGVPPDVVGFDRFAIGEWAGRGALADLTPMLGHQLAADPHRIDLKEYYPWTVQEASYRPPGTDQTPHIFGIPTSADLRVMFSNANHLRQEGLIDPKTGAPRPPTTWSELMEDAKKLSRFDANGVLTRLGFAPNVGNSWLYLYAFQAGGDFLSKDGTKVLLDSPPVVRGLRFMTDLYDELGGVKAVNGFVAGLQTGALDPFLLGKVSMKIDGNTFLTTIADWKRDMDFVVTPAPMPDDAVAAGKPPVTWSGGYSLVIPSTSRQKEGAFKLIQFLVSRQTYRFLEQSKREAREADGRLYLVDTTSNRVLFEEQVKEAIEDNPNIPATFRQSYAVIKRMLPLTRIRPVSPVGQLLWNQHIRATDAATNHLFASVAKDKNDEMRIALSTMQVDVQRALDAILKPPPPTVVRWSSYFIAYGLLLVAIAGAGMIAFRRNRVRHGYRAREVGESIVFLSPWLIGMICLTGGPILFSIVMSITRYDVLSPARYVGTANYAEVLRDPIFFKSLGNTAFMILRIPLLMAVGLAIAMLLNRPIRGIGAYRTAFFMPTIVPAVAASLLWTFLLSPNFGAVNVALRWLYSTFPFTGFEWGVNHLFHFASGPFHFTAPMWLQDPAWSKPSLVLMSLWGAGGGMIIWLAGLQAIPRQLYEAAAIDGAGKWRQFLNVTLPMLSPYILFNAITGLIGTMQIFTEAYIMTSGGPADSTLFYAYYVFRQAFQYFRMGYASALAWIMFVIVLILTLIQLWVSRRWVHYEQT